MENNINKNTVSAQNLLNNTDFKNLLRFEAEYASAIRGGSYPAYQNTQSTSRLVSDINFLSSSEQKELSFTLLKRLS